MLDRKHVVTAAMNGYSAERYLGELMTLASIGDVHIKFDSKANTCTVSVRGVIAEKSNDPRCSDVVGDLVVTNGPGTLRDKIIDPLTMCIIELRPLWMKECVEE